MNKKEKQKVLIYIETNLVKEKQRLDLGRYNNYYEWKKLKDEYVKKIMQGGSL